MNMNNKITYPKNEWEFNYANHTLLLAWYIFQQENEKIDMLDLYHKYKTYFQSTLPMQEITLGFFNIFLAELINNEFIVFSEDNKKKVQEIRNIFNDAQRRNPEPVETKLFGDNPPEPYLVHDRYLNLLSKYLTINKKRIKDFLNEYANKENFPSVVGCSFEHYENIWNQFVKDFVSSNTMIINQTVIEKIKGKVPNSFRLDLLLWVLWQQKKIEVSNIKIWKEPFIFNCEVKLIKKSGADKTNSKKQSLDLNGVSWSDITLKFLDKENVSILVTRKCIKKKVGYEEMGFKNKSAKKITKPTKQWWLLFKLAQNRNCPIEGNLKKRASLFQQKKKLKEQLQNYFRNLGLEDKSDPFHDHTKYGASITEEDKRLGESTWQDYRDGNDYSLKMKLIPPVGELGGICIEE